MSRCVRKTKLPYLYWPRPALTCCFWDTLSAKAGGKERPTSDIPLAEVVDARRDKASQHDIRNGAESFTARPTIATGQPWDGRCLEARLRRDYSANRERCQVRPPPMATWLVKTFPAHCECTHG